MSRQLWWYIEHITGKMAQDFIRPLVFSILVAVKKLVQYESYTTWLAHQCLQWRSKENEKFSDFLY